MINFCNSLFVILISSLLILTLSQNTFNMTISQNNNIFFKIIIDTIEKRCYTINVQNIVYCPGD